MSVKILLVDDDPVALFLHKAVMMKSAFPASPICFESAGKCLRFIESDHSAGNSYLVFLDVNMPGMSGWQFVEEIERRRLSAAVPVVILTSSVDEADHRRARAYSGIVSYLEKPVTVSAINRIKEVPTVKILMPNP